MVFGGVSLLLGGTAALAAALWTVGPGRSIAIRSAYGRGALVAAPAQFAGGLVAVATGLIFLVGK